MGEIAVMTYTKPKSYKRAWNYIMGGLVALSMVVITLAIIYAH